MSNKEIWKDIKGFEGCYQVSNKGRVRSLDRVAIDGRRLKGNILKNDNTSGYLRVVLQKNRCQYKRLVHRLVLSAFIKNKENKPQVNHIDGNPFNNNISNLEWCTNSENMKHAYETGLQKPLKGIKNNLSKKVVMLEAKTKKVLMFFSSTVEASEYVNGNKHAIRNCCRGLTKTSSGFSWEYKKNKFNIDKEISKHKEFL